MAKAKEKAPKGEKVTKAKAPKRRKAPLVDRLTGLVVVLFLASLAIPHLVP